MKPFIARYEEKPIYNQDALFKLKYDPKLEMSVIDNCVLPRKSFQQVVQMTGSYFTRAEGDPTSDESTDR